MRFQAMPRSYGQKFKSMNNLLNPENLENEYIKNEGNLPALISYMANTYWYERPAAAAAFKKVSFLDYRPRRIRTIALYFRKIRNGGAERVVAQLAGILSQLKTAGGKPKYRVVLITDEDPTADDYPLSPLVCRAKLPSNELFPENDFTARVKGWWDLIEKYDIDVVFHSQWFQSYALWDLLSVKSHPTRPAFVFHIHTFCARLYSMDYMDVAGMEDTISLADGAVTLSSCDRKYWQRVNRRTYMIGNPPTFKSDPGSRACFGKEILWIGRVAAAKRPLEVVPVIKKVTEAVPDAVCRFVGSEDEKLMEELKAKIAEAGLEENIILEGFHADVRPFYLNASVFLMVSRFEGFSLTIMESAAHGLPIVMYDMPWLEANKILDGLTCVPQLDTDAAAAEIIKLITDEELWKEKSDALFESFRRYESYDIGAQWEKILKDLERNTLPPQAESDPEYDIILERIAGFHSDLRRELIRSRNDFQRQSYERLACARIDIKNEGSAANDIKILEISDADAKIISPSWMRGNGNGKLITSKAGALRIRVKCSGAGTLRLSLRGENLTGPDGKRIPVRVEYLSFAAGREKIFSNPRIIWHDRPFKFEKEVKDGQIVTFRVQWNNGCICIGPKMMSGSLQ